MPPPLAAMMMISVPPPTSTERPDVVTSSAAQCLVLLWREGLAVAVESREAAARIKRDLKETILSVFVRLVLGIYVGKRIINGYQDVKSGQLKQLVGDRAFRERKILIAQLPSNQEQ